MGRRREHGLWRRRFLNELSSATAHAECTLADACELAYGCERLREVFRRAHGAENEDGGGTREGWRARFERATPRDVAAALGEIRGLLKVVDEETYARGIDGDAHVAIEGDEPMGERGRGRAGARRAECPFCKKKFVESHLPSHVAKQHTGARPVKCSHVGCDEYFADERAMRRHVVLIHEQKYKCGVCGKAFSTKQMQERHEDSAHAERKKTIPCPVDGCTVMFSNVGSISDHMKRAHSNAKPYACTYPGCSAKFATSSDKARHFRTHFGDNARPGAASRSMSVHLSQSRSELVRKRARARSFEDDLVPELTDPSLMSKWLLVGGDEASEL
ncbi:Zinc finger C2H2-type/integrase DNA-binding domain [Ostreococcus tauri]|uniref:Zinc finger C2H2-type/integrase DNA-binding domain n=1 Tax=Ostreococcus tauri TaxID=70448 RepID=A0A090M8Q1_OSTTA|nr:Zinc finger C2H2-type/integrase DNA-binding domain [Ostreococcus tauri]CEG01538.1 Zinc finger C2H2-type/integrase DNA-binding domain [Ostreococcus tauri]|eukprot:XP_022841017.1 Zinc finger C2H2-type/integrase DNA-binding domain [Ostreococcus tauri]